jgi:hypothetical protein
LGVLIDRDGTEKREREATSLTPPILDLDLLQKKIIISKPK